MLHGAIVIIRILHTHHCRVPLAYGSPEFTIRVIVKMGHSAQNKHASFKCEESLVEQYYKEPVDSKFKDITDSVLKDLKSYADEETEEKKQET